MSTRSNNVQSLVDIIQRKAPEYLDLMTANSEEDFERAFDAILGIAISKLEQNKVNFDSLNEVGLSGALGMALSIPGLSVHPEQHSNGHVDLMIVFDHCTPPRVKLGEAKIYGGPEYHLSGLQQLLGRYTTGREGRGMLIVYFRKQNISGLVKKVRQTMDSDLPFSQKGQTRDHALRWSFLSMHTHSCGDDLEIGHIGCNLYIDTANGSGS